jgi:pimeloyl-ACP methyl ester carboxylesterase
VTQEITVRFSAGERVSAVVQGRGPALVVVHPGGQDAASWDAVAALLQGEFTILRVRRRLYVADMPLSPAHSMEIEAADIAAVMRSVDGPVVLVGHSSGAVAAFEAALGEHPRLAGLIVYEPPMPVYEPFGGDALTRALHALDSGEPLEAMRIHLRDIVGMDSSAVTELMDNEHAAEALAAIASRQLADDQSIEGLPLGIDRYRQLTMPVALLEGEWSPKKLRDTSNALARELPNASTVTLRATGHMAHLDAPGELAGAIRTEARIMFTKARDVRHECT